MSDIYIVYAREDEAVAEKLYGLLSQQWETWWDDKIVERFRQDIESEVPKAKCMVAILSQSSRDKDTFNDELRLGQKHNLKILLTSIDNSEAPYPFGGYRVTKMHGWNGEADHRGFMQLQRRLTSAVTPRIKPKRPPALATDKLPLPTLFFSVSSYDTQLKPPAAAVSALRVFRAPSILISAYDLVRNPPEAVIKELAEYQADGGFVLIDSGNYEASRLGDASWNPDDLRKALSMAPHDWAFCFDVMKSSLEPDVAVDQILAAVERDRAFTSKPILPIVHAPELENGGYQLKNIPWIVREVAERLNPPLIAIPERELGHGLIARAKTIQEIRKELNKLPFYQPIHLLGTGNPWSIPILAAAGADTFDGLEWCRMAVDRTTHRLHHFQHFDFFTYQIGEAESPITRSFCEDNRINFTGKVVFNNLDYYSVFMKDMREYFNDDNIESFMLWIMGDTAKRLKKQIPGLFK